MSSASHLFSAPRSRRRSRTGSGAAPPAPPRCRHHGSNPPGRRRGPRSEHEFHASSNAGIVEHGADDGNQPSTRNNRINGHGFDRNDRLPPAVLQARARLLQRLRGTSFTGTRSGLTRDTHSNDGPSEGADFSEWDPAYMWWLREIAPLHEPTTPLEQPLACQCRSKKHSGLDCMTISSLKQGTFGREDCKDDTVHISSDCSICLEMFVEEDDFVKLPCNHTFHTYCLVPWLRSRCDCPNCRVLVTSNQEEKQRHR